MSYSIDQVFADLQIPRPGWLGNYTTQQATGALPNGTRVSKAAEDAAGDFTPIGTHGTVLGSMGHPTKGIGYFIEWDDKPKCAVLAVHWKVKAAP